MLIAHQQFDLFGCKIFEKMQVKSPFRMPGHMKDKACYMYLIEGDYRQFSSTQEYRLTNHESLLMKCGNYMLNLPGPPANCNAFSVHFYPEVLKKIYENDLPSFLIDPAAMTTNNTAVKLGSSVSLKSYVDSMLFYFENPELVNDDLIILKLKEIILLLSRTESAPQVYEILSNLFTPQTIQFKEVVESHVYSSISLEELAELTNCSLSSFKREFKRLYNESPATYLRNKKLEKACELLRVSEESISHIAYDCGFYDVAHFSKTFKLKYNVSPSSYRLDA